MRSEVYLTVSRIKKLYPSFSKTQKVIARYLIENPTKILSLGIDEFAEEISVSRASVFRFCNELGLSGYKDLQRQFATPRPQLDEEGLDPILSWIIKSSFDTIFYTLNNLDVEAFEKCVSLLTNANRILWYGAGESGILAELGNHRCWSLGIDSHAFTETIESANTSVLQDPANVYVFISVSGTRPILTRPLQLIKDHDLTMMAITSNHISPLVDIASVTLFAAAPRANTETSSVPIRLGYEALINALLYKTALARGIHLDFRSELF